MTVAQPWVVALDVADNAERHAELVRAAPARVVVFPELSLTGYELKADPIDPADHRLEPLVDASAQTGALVLAGAPTTGPTGDHLSILAIDGDGATVVYHKMFLGGDEIQRFAPGTGPTVVEVDGWRLGLAICRDTGVAEHADRTAALGIDAYLAGVCELAADHEVVGERARRIAEEHGVWVGVASFAGTTGHGYAPAAGRSGVWSPNGRSVDQAGSETGRTITARFSR